MRTLALLLLLLVATSLLVTLAEQDYVTRTETTYTFGRVYVYESKREHRLTLRSPGLTAKDTVELYGAKIVDLHVHVYEEWLLQPEIEKYIKMKPAKLASLLEDTTTHNVAKYLTQPIISMISMIISSRLTGEKEKAIELANTLLSIFANTSFYNITSKLLETIAEEQINKTRLTELADKLYSGISRFSDWLSSRLLRYEDAIPDTDLISFSGYGSLTASSVVINRVCDSDYYRITYTLSVKYNENKTSGIIETTITYIGKTSMDYIVSDNSDYALLLTRIYSPRVVIALNVTTDKVVSTSHGSFKVYIDKTSGNWIETENGFRIMSSNVLVAKIGFSKISESGGGETFTLPFNPFILVFVVIVGVIGAVYFLKVKRRGRGRGEGEEEYEEEYEESEETEYEEEEEEEGYE